MKGELCDDMRIKPSEDPLKDSGGTRPLLGGTGESGYAPLLFHHCITGNKTSNKCAEREFSSSAM